MTEVEGASFGTVHYASADGTPGRGWLSRPPGPCPFPGVILGIESWGLSEHMRHVAERFAEHGYLVLVPDLYVRDGDTVPRSIPEVIERWYATPDEQALGDLRGALAYLQAHPNCNGTIGAVGFCSGGRYVLMLACTTPGLAAVVDCYGGRVVRADPKPTQPTLPLMMLDGLACPLLAVFGDRDQDPTVADIEVLRAELERLGKDSTIKVYAGAGHAFLNETSPVLYSPTHAEQAWPEILGWCANHLRPRVPSGARGSAGEGPS